MKLKSTQRPARVRRRSVLYLRVTLKFRRRRRADEDRARVQDALIRAHGFRAIAGLTAGLARSLGRFRTYVSASAIAAFKQRVLALVRDGGVRLWVGGVAV